MLAVKTFLGNCSANASWVFFIHRNNALFSLIRMTENEHCMQHSSRYTVILFVQFFSPHLIAFFRYLREEKALLQLLQCLYIFLGNKK